MLMISGRMKRNVQWKELMWTKGVTQWVGAAAELERGTRKVLMVMSLVPRASLQAHHGHQFTRVSTQPTLRSRIQ